MEFSQVKKWIHKMNQIMDLYEDEQGFTLKEKELLLDYSKRINDSVQALLTVDEQNPPIKAKEVATIIPEVKPEIQFIEPIEVPKKIEVVIPVAQTIEPIAEKIITPVYETTPVPVDNTKFKSLFDHLNVNDLAEKLTITPIKDLTSALGLNERVLAQNELFDGNKLHLEEFLRSTNSLNSFEEAKSILVNDLIPKYKWNEDTKSEIAKKLIKIVYRRFL